jgi:hypothetical protein
MDGGGKLVFVGGSCRKWDQTSECLTKPGIVAGLPIAGNLYGAAW